MAKTRFHRAYETLSVTFADHGVGVAHVDQPLDFGEVLRSEEEAMHFGSRIRSRGYRIEPQFFVDLHRERRVLTVGELASTLAGNDDTPGRD